MYLKIPFTEDYVQKDFMIGQKAPPATISNEKELQPKLH